MATRDVGEAELLQAHFDGWMSRIGGADHLAVRDLGDGRAVYLDELLFDALQVGIGRVGAPGCEDIWHYLPGNLRAAWIAALGWDGQGEPEGWYRHPATGRYRPDGDAAKEHR